MQKVDFPVMPPSVCFLCTAAHTDTPFADTFMSFDPGVMTGRNGRIYVCEPCAQTVADALDLFAPHKERIEEAEERTRAAEEKLKAFENIESLLAQYRSDEERLAKRTHSKSTPTKKKA